MNNSLKKDFSIDSIRDIFYEPRVRRQLGGAVQNPEKMTTSFVDGPLLDQLTFIF